MLYFKDAAINPAIHSGFVEHDELEISDDELQRLKSRASRAVTMDKATAERVIPEDYRSFLDGGRRSGGYDDFLAGRQK